MTKKQTDPLHELSTNDLIAELARRRADETSSDMSGMELDAERDAAALKSATMAERLRRLSLDEDDTPKPCPKCGGFCRVKSKNRERKLQTLSGEQRLLRNYHHCKSCRHGWHPVDEKLGLPKNGNVTLEVEKRILDFGITEVFADAAERWSVHYPSTISENLVRQVVERVGKCLEEMEHEELQQRLRESPADSNDIVIVSVDGCMLPMRGKDPWREAKLGVVGRLNEKKRLTSSRYVARLGTVEDLEGPLRAALSVEKANESMAVWVGDGAAWVWNLAEKLLPDAHQVLDWPHVAEHISDCAKNIFVDDDGCRKLWCDRAKDLAWGGSIEKLLLELNACLDVDDRSNQATSALHGLARYLRTHKERMNYSVFQAAGMPIGSGIVESGHRHVLQQRMKRAGQHWDPRRADRMTQMRAAWRTAGPHHFHRAIRGKHQKCASA